MLFDINKVYVNVFKIFCSLCLFEYYRKRVKIGLEVLECFM
jgi:hypothetical protein